MEHILVQLRGLPAHRMLSIKGNRAVIRCPFHANGFERTPSLGVLLEDKGTVPAGAWHCFGCGKHGHFNTLASELGMKLLSRRSERESRSSVLSWGDSFKESPVPKENVFKWPKSMSWRGMPGVLLGKFGAESVCVGSSFLIRLPVTYFDNRVGHIDCTLDKSPNGRSYINSPGPWISSNLFGFDQSRPGGFKGRPLWIVEGPRDALNVHAAKCRAVALLGASSINADKINRIQEIDPPVVVIATDSDDAGDRAAAALTDLLSSLYPVRRYLFKERNKDPADLVHSEIVRADQNAANSVRTHSYARKHRRYA